MEGVGNLNGGVLDVPTIGVDALDSQLLFTLRKTDEGRFVWVLDLVGDYFWRGTRLNRWGAACDHHRKYRRGREEGVKVLTQMSMMLGLDVLVGSGLVC